MPYRAIAARALAAWRAAHARMESATPDSADWQAADLEEQTARAAYQDAVDAARREHLPEPPPFAEVSAAEETETEMTPPTVDGQLYGG